ncbi:hypothetical protein FACS1894191_3330 [Clostridia bacterium]|nr:hypothetical protein FACS1894191_3330 [Clostridia bacterium]
MTIFDFTVEETSLISIYKADTRAATLARIADALPDMEDEDIIIIAESAVVKLRAMSDSDFTAALFSPADEDEGE